LRERWSEEIAGRVSGRTQSMNVKIADAAQIALTNLREDDRRKLGVWIDRLKHWETDPFVQGHSKRLDPGDDVYMLVTNTDVRIFFSRDKDSITILDVAKKATILRSGIIPEAGER
jgi:hypothetical protein